MENRVNYFSLSLMFSIYTGTAPSYFNEFIQVSHPHRTRYSDKSFSIPNVNTQGKKSFRYNGIILWNSLPGSIKQIEDKQSFKRECKNLLFQKMSNIENSDYI